MSTLVSILVYSTAVLIGLSLFSVGMVVVGGWLVQTTDDPDAGH